MTEFKLNLNHFSADDQQLIKKAYEFAANAHRGQKRKSGDPYIAHPLAVAETVAAWHQDAAAVAAALLHDVVEDTGVALELLESEFGAEVAELVDAVTKLGKIKQAEHTDEPTQIQQASSENIRKLLLAMSKDLRVIVIKLADRLHNLKTLTFLPAAKRRRIAQESLEIFAPLADRLGMGQLKAEMEDLAFRYAYPEKYAEVKKLMAHYITETNQYIIRLKRFIAEELTKAGVKPLNIEGRQKHLYSVYKKLGKAEGNLEKIYDLIAIRVLVPKEPDCYQALGVLHQHFKPLIYRIKDYIAVPKPNGYRSLHTTVFALDGRITEIQIRTPQMHEEAERGLAAHFYYDAQKASKAYRKGQAATLPAKLQWVNKLSQLQTAAKPEELLEELKIDLFGDRIFVFSPKGDLFDLPVGSTPVDFAFEVHSDIGWRTQGAKVNGKIVPLDHKLENRDVVDILTRKEPRPNQDWLAFVKTADAKNRIRSWLRSHGQLE